MKRYGVAIFLVWKRTSEDFSANFSRFWQLSSPFTYSGILRFYPVLCKFPREPLPMIAIKLCATVPRSPITTISILKGINSIAYLFCFGQVECSTQRLEFLQATPHPINKVVNNYFTRAGWGINNEPTPHKEGSELLLYQRWVGYKQLTPPTPPPHPKVLTHDANRASKLTRNISAHMKYQTLRRIARYCMSRKEEEGGVLTALPDSLRFSGDEMRS